MSKSPVALTETSVRQVSGLLTFLVHGKSKLSQHFTKWCIKGPTIGADASVVAMVLEESGHTSILKSIARDSIFGNQDALVFNCLENMSKSWEEFIANIFVYDQFLDLVFQAAKHSAFTPLQEGIPKILEEEKFHRQFFLEWARILGMDNILKQEWIQYVENALVELQQNLATLTTDDLVAEQILSESVNEIYEKHRRQILQQCAEWQHTGV